MNEQSTEGKVVEKSILKDKSKSLFKGMIRINENASTIKFIFVWSFNPIRVRVQNLMQFLDLKFSQMM